MSDTAAKKDIQKLQRAIVDGLEDVKAHDIRVFNTEHLTPLFERVIVGSGNSNRQTKALAASVRDKVREAGFAKPRVEGEDNGEWIIVDCGMAVAHIMQPAIRQYYNLEEIWGEKPVRLKGPAAKAAAKRAAKEKEKAEAAAAKPAPAAKKAAAKKAPARKATAQAPAKKAAAKKAPARKAGISSASGRSATTRTTGARAGSASAAPRKRSSGSATMQTVVVNKPSARSAPKAAPKAAARSPAAKAPARTAAKKMAPRSAR